MRIGLRLFFCLIFLAAVVGCTELISLDTPGTARQLVVDGSVNNLNEGSWVRLSTSTPGLDAVGSNTLGQNARVSLIHEDQAFPFEEVEPGGYFLGPDVFQGEVGETYHLRIITADNRTYESGNVTIPTPVEIADSRVELVQLNSETDQGVALTGYFHDVFPEFVNGQEDQFIKIDNRGMAEVFVDYPLTLCGLNENLPRGPAAGLSCWSFRDPISRAIQLTTNVGLNRSENYEALGVRVPFQFQARYVTTLTANNMSVDSFNYWEKIRSQLNNVGGPFEPPIEPLPGNIRNVEDPQEVVLGYFHAYGATVVNTCFDRNDVPLTADIPIVPPPCLITCEEFWAPATFDDPEGLELCE